MDGLFDNILVLIPIAIVVIRVINAVGGGKRRSGRQQPSSQQPQQRPPQNPQRQNTAQKTVSREELARKIREAQGIPEYRDVQARPAAKPAAQKKTVPHWIAEQAKKKPAAQKPKQTTHHAALPSEDVQRAATVHQETVREMALQKTPSEQKPPETGLSMPGLSTLQQAFVWSEILGPPKGVSA